MPKISIITPTYNRAHFLTETINHVLSQDFRDFEYLIIDDGSVDNTKEVVNTFLKIDPRVKYYYHENRGESFTVNRGWNLAQGELVVINNSDDPLKAGFIREVVQFMDEHLSIIVGYPDWEVIDENGKVVRIRKVPEFDQVEMIVSHLCYPGPGAVIRKSALKEVQELRDLRYRYSSDLATWWNLIFYGDFARIPKNIARWRDHEGTITHFLPLEAIQEHQLLLEEFFARKDIPEAIVKRKEEAYKKAALIMADIELNYYEKSVDLKRRWFILKRFLAAPGLSKHHIKIFIKLFLGNKTFLVVKKLFYTINGIFNKRME